MRAIALALASLSVLVVSAQEVETDDIPTQCRDVCLDTLAIADQCNQDDDDAELNCICNAQSASSTIPNCEACVAQFDEEDNDVRDVVSSCSFTRATTFTTPMFSILPTATTGSTTRDDVTSVIGSNTNVQNTVTATATDDGDDSSTVTTPTVTTTSTDNDGSGTDVTTTVTETPTPSGDGGNVAAGLFAPGAGAFGAALIAAAGLV